jgi:hypothetical protein
LGIRGVLQSIASNLYLRSVEGQKLNFILDEGAATLFEREHVGRLQEILSKCFKAAIELDLQVSPLALEFETPYRQGERLKAERRAAGLENLRSDPVVCDLQNQFDAKLNEASLTFVN